MFKFLLIMRWPKGEKWTIISIFIVTIVVSQIIYIIEESQKPKKPQIEASDICLDYDLGNYIALFDE